MWSGELCCCANGTDNNGYLILCTLDARHDGPHVWSGECGAVDD